MHVMRYPGILRTTISLDGELLAMAKKTARQSGLTLGELIEEALHRHLAPEQGSTHSPAIPVFRAGDGVRPGIDVTSNRALIEALDEGEPFEKLR